MTFIHRSVLVTQQVNHPISLSQLAARDADSYSAVTTVLQGLAVFLQINRIKDKAPCSTMAAETLGAIKRKTVVYSHASVLEAGMDPQAVRLIGSTVIQNSLITQWLASQGHEAHAILGAVKMDVESHGEIYTWGLGFAELVNGSIVMSVTRGSEHANDRDELVLTVIRGCLHLHGKDSGINLFTLSVSQLLTRLYALLGEPEDAGLNDYQRAVVVQVNRVKQLLVHLQASEIKEFHLLMDGFVQCQKAQTMASIYCEMSVIPSAWHKAIDQDIQKLKEAFHQEASSFVA